MNRPNYLSKYNFNWEMFDILIGGRAALDAQHFLGKFDDQTQVQDFLEGYGFDPGDLVQKAELFGHFQEAMQFIRRYFLKEGHDEGLALSIPTVFYTITDINELLLIAVRKSSFTSSGEDALWASIILKVMHTILHADKDLRYRYFSTIQQQIFDRFYRHISRDDEGKLFLQNSLTGDKIRIAGFETKAKKSRESIIVKLLLKSDSVAEELFDRIGVRIITENRSDTFRVMNFLQDSYVIMTHNVHPGRSYNSLLDINKFKARHHELIKEAIRNDMPEDVFLKKVEEAAHASLPDEPFDLDKNKYSATQYRSIHFTGRLLIKYRNPFMEEFRTVKSFTRDLERESEELKANPNVKKLIDKINALDTSSVSRETRFFYPFEVQITDKNSHEINTQGEASHREYKKAQQKSAMKRLFAPLLSYLERQA